MQELRYVRHKVADLEDAARFAADTVGLMVEETSDTAAYFRADHRHYGLCLCSDDAPAIGISVRDAAELDALRDRLIAAGQDVQDITDIDARMIRRGFSIEMPCGVLVEIVWRHLENGWPYHGPRATGITGLAAVQLASTDPAADAALLDLLGMSLTDRVGDASFLSLGGAHHQVAIYPSQRSGLLGIIWQVESTDHVMRQWHWLEARQLPVAHGPGKQPTSGAAFVTARAPDGLLHSYATAMDPPSESGPRQFSDAPASHCAWGSPTDQPEFGGQS